MITYVLLIMIHSQSNSVSFGYFNSLDSCNRAAQQLILTDNENNHQIVLAKCQEK